MTRTALEPDPALSGWWLPIVYATEEFDAPASVRAFVESLNLAHREARAAQVAMAAFAGNWQPGAIDQRIAAVGGTVTLEAMDAATTELLELEDHARRADWRRRLADRLVEKLDARARNTFHETAIAPALKAALAELLADVAKLPKNTPTTAEAALAGTPALQDAYRRLGVLEARYATLRSAWRALRESPAAVPTRDSTGLFADSPVWPSTRPSPTVNPRSHRPAGPTGRVRLLWLAAEGHGWFPSVAEQDAAYVEWSGPAPRQPSIDAGPLPEDSGLPVLEAFGTPDLAGFR